jgi:hypothetical protein
VAPGRATAEPARTASSRRTAGLVVGGLGVAGLGVGGILGIVALAKNGSANASSACKGPTSDMQDVDGCNAQRDAARGLQTAGIVSAVAGGLALAGGVALVAMPSRTTGTQTGALAPLILVLHPVGAVGASLTGRF